MHSCRRTRRALVLGTAAGGLLAACAGDPAGPPECPTRVATPGPALLRLTIQSVTTGTPPAPVDPAAVRGIVTLTANVGAELVPAAGARVEWRAAGRAVAVAPVPAPGAADLVPVALTADTRARDASGARVIPDDRQMWTVALLAGRTLPAGCAPVTIGEVGREVTVANP